MDFDRNKTFPYPVLRPYSDDYLDVEFQATVQVTVDANSVCINFSYLTSCAELIEEIQKGRAAYCSVVSCRDTYYRRAITSKKEEASEVFDAVNLRGEVRVESYIVCLKKIQSFSSADINKEFAKPSFTFLPGQVMAQDETSVVYIDRDLFKPLTAVFDLVKNDSLLVNEWRVDLDEDHVQIQVSPTMKEVIDDARNSTPNKAILLNSLYMSAVTEALHKLRDAPDQFAQTRWGGVMVRQLQNHNIDLHSTEAYVAAQALMRHPLGVLRAYVFEGSK